MNRLLETAALAAAGAVLLAGCQTTDKVGKIESAATARSQIVNQPAPDFALPDQDGREVTLSALRGRWIVLYFYPKDDSPGCSCQAPEFTYLVGRFRDMNADVYGISPDTPESHRRFIDKYALALTLLSDPDHEVMTRYGAWVATAFGDQKYYRVIRTTMIIDPEGIIRHHWPEVTPAGHAERVRSKLAELQSSYRASP